MVEEEKDETKKEELEKEELKLVLSTTKSIHDPIEVEIDGKTYQNNPFSRATFDKVKKHEEAALKGDTEGLYKQVQAFQITIFRGKNTWCVTQSIRNLSIDTLCQ